jgi:hypothetical protein
MSGVVTMNNTHLKRHNPKLAAVLAAVLISSSCAAQADEHEDLEKLRATVLSLIDTLVKNKILPKDKADAMMREAESRANARLAETPPPEIGQDGKKIVRVPYVPDAVKVQMREQIKAEVLAVTRKENSGGVAASWINSIQFGGDLRLRGESIMLDKGNTAPGVSYPLMTTNGLSRFPDVSGTTNNGGNNVNYNYNAQQDSKRSRLRARLAANANVSDAVSGGIALATGSLTGPTSTNQTMGQNFNKEGIFVDRAFIKYSPASWISMSGGRFQNPYFGTDLLWADDLNFEGFALAFKPHLTSLATVFMTAGWFPLNYAVPNKSTSSSLFALQGGLDWPIGEKDNRLKLGAGLFNYSGIRGEKQTTQNFQNSPTYLSSVYGFGQRGNTLFRINAPNSGAAPDMATNWGLASNFRELNLTGVVDVAEFDPTHVILTLDWVKNLGFNRNDISRRTGVNITDGKSTGYLGRIQVGATKMAKRGDWNATLGYRYLGSDAVLDAFTNSDFGLGGTNSKGTVLGVNYGIERNTWVSARWMSSSLIDSLVPMTPTKFSADLIQLDLNTRF